MSRSLKETSTELLEANLRQMFADNREVFEELILRGWTVTLDLGTHGVMLNYGYSPMGLSSDAGFRVSRVVTPVQIRYTIEDKNGMREHLR